MPRAVSSAPRAEPSDAGAGPDGAPASRATPMMAQYLAIKAEHPDSLLLYRMGDFYELFLDDAVAAAPILGIVLTRRGRHDGEDIPMCGVPIERGEDALARLIAAGRRVAVCEQTEDPAEARRRGGKSVVGRAVVRLVTPGTLTEDRLLDPARPNRLAAVARRREPGGRRRYALAHLDISTGRFAVGETDAAGLGAALARVDPSELVLPDDVRDEPDLRALWRDARFAVAPAPRDGMDPASAERRLREHYEVSTLDGFGAFTRAEVAAAGAALAYVLRTQCGERPALGPLRPENGGDALAIDAATRANLELTRTLGGERAGSLLGAVDRTRTAAGARLLAERLGAPLTDVAAVARRHDAVAFLLADGDLRTRLRETLARAPDISRALARLGLGRGGPRDLAGLRDGLAAAAGLGTALAEAGGAPDELAAAAADLLGVDGALGAALDAALAESPPHARRDGGFVRAGFDEALDEARALGADARGVIAALQGRYVAETGCRTLRVKHNGQLGYFVEVPSAAGEALVGPERRGAFIHRQTMAGAMRFTTAELSDLQAGIDGAGERALALELAHFDRLAAAAAANADAIRAMAEALAVVDVTAALAELAAAGGWTRPTVEEGAAFQVSGGRHPVVEAALAREGAPFVANDCDLGDGEGPGRLLVVTGPNMGGKSTFLRQQALLVVLAQAGSFVPAASARIGIVDRLFSRVGAADDLARGRSTFMVEMVETAAILNGATDRSLVILDEIGRGTATFDGLSIAWAAIEHLHDAVRCRGLFATHFHELTRLGERLPRVANATLKATEWRGDVVFLHEVTAGAADRSYGLQVAKLAGLPPPVLRRARAVLAELERSDRERPRTALLDELPLFAAARAPEPEPAEPGPDPLRAALAALQPDALTPREALEALYALRARLDAEGG